MPHISFVACFLLHGLVYLADQRDKHKINWMVLLNKLDVLNKNLNCKKMEIKFCSSKSDYQT